MQTEVGDFLEELPPPVHLTLEELVLQGKLGRLDRADVDTMIKLHGYSMDHFQQMPGGWFGLKPIMEVVPDGE